VCQPCRRVGARRARACQLCTGRCRASVCQPCRRLGARRARVCQLCTGRCRARVRQPCRRLRTRRARVCQLCTGRCRARVRQPCRRLGATATPWHCVYVALSRVYLRECVYDSLSRVCLRECVYDSLSRVMELLRVIAHSLSKVLCQPRRRLGATATRRTLDSRRWRDRERTANRHSAGRGRNHGIVMVRSGGERECAGHAGYRSEPSDVPSRPGPEPPSDPGPGLLRRG
jgi:hypothetical protein